MSVVQRMLANPSAFLPEGHRWSEFATVEKISMDRNPTLGDDGVIRTSPCCNAAIGGVLSDTSIIGLCRGCGSVVCEFDVVQKAVRVAEKVA